MEYPSCSETGCRRRCETRRPRFATQILDAFWNRLSHHIIREWCLWYFVHYLTIWLGSHVYHPDAFLGLRKMHFVHYLTIWLGSDVYHPDACFGLRKLHFVHYHISPYDWGVMLITRMLFWDWGKCILPIISPYDEGVMFMIFCPLSHHMIRESCLSPGCYFGAEENAFCPLSHHMIRESCLSPGCFFGTEENAFCPLSHHMMREWCLPPGCFFWGWGKCILSSISPYDYGVMFIPHGAGFLPSTVGAPPNAFYGLTDLHPTPVKQLSNKFHDLK